MTIRFVLASIVLFLSTSRMHAQFFDYIDIPDGPSTSVTCNGTTYNDILTNWEAYQTEDNSWQGTHLEGQCLLYNGYEIILDGYDHTRAVFLRYLGPPIQVPVNAVCTFRAVGMSESSVDFWDIDQCMDGICQGVIAGIEVPDDPADEDDDPEMRWHPLEMYATNPLAESAGDRQFGCFGSERFEEQYLKEIILRLNPVQGLSGLSCSLSSFRYAAWIPSLQDYSVNGNNEVSLWDNALAINDLPAFPSESSVDTIFFQPFNNPDQQQTITVLIDGGYSSLTFQPFTMISGGPVEGNPLLHHPLHIVADQGNVCISEFWGDVVSNPGETLQLIGADLLMNRHSCFRFVTGATLMIGPDTDYLYGKHGSGMLALHSGAKVVLLEESAFTLNTTLVLFDNSWEESPHFIHIYLRPGQIWRFGPLAHIDNRSEGDAMKVIFHLEGGLLDLGILSPEERRHIEVITPAEESPLRVLRTIPSGEGEWIVEFNAHQQGEMHAEAFDLSGKLIYSQAVHAESGYNQFRLQLTGVAASAAILRLRQGSLLSEGVKVVR